MEAGDIAEELDASDAVDRWVDGRERVDETDGNVVAIDVITLDRGLLAWARDRGGVAISGLSKRRRKGGCKGQLAPWRLQASETAWISPDMSWSMAVQDRLRGGGLGLEDRPFGNIAVPFDQRRNCAAAADDYLEELPDRVRHRAVMTVDEHEIAFVVGLLGVSRQMDLTHPFERKIDEIVERGITMVGRTIRRRC